MVLGQHIDGLSERWAFEERASDIESHRHRHHNANCLLFVGDRPCPVVRASKLLSSKPGQNPIFLHRPVAPENRPLVLHRRHHPELLAIGSVWPQLALPLGLTARTHLGDLAPPAHLLRRRLGPYVARPRPSEQTALVDHPDFLRRPRRAPMGADAVGCWRYRNVCTLGLARFRSHPRPRAVVLDVGSG